MECYSYKAKNKAHAIWDIDLRYWLSVSSTGNQMLAHRWRHTSMPFFEPNALAQIRSDDDVAEKKPTAQTLTLKLIRW